MSPREAAIHVWEDETSGGFVVSHDVPEANGGVSSRTLSVHDEWWAAVAEGREESEKHNLPLITNGEQRLVVKNDPYAAFSTWLANNNDRTEE